MRYEIIARVLICFQFGCLIAQLFLIKRTRSAAEALEHELAKVKAMSLFRTVKMGGGFTNLRDA